MFLMPKAILGAGIASPGIKHGLRWFINNPRIPARLRQFAHHKVAKRARFARDATFDYRLSNGTSLTFLHHGTPNYLFWTERYEPETMSLFLKLAARASTILDIGASDGIYAILAAATNPKARVVAFEPVDDTARVAARNIAMNLPSTRNIEFCHMALSDEDGEAMLHVAGRSGGASSLNPAFRRVSRPQHVVVRRGDAVLAERGLTCVDLIKLDTESTEPAVLRGMTKMLQRDRPDLFCEILHGRTDGQIEPLLGPLAYHAYHVTADGLRPMKRIVVDVTHRELNYFFSVRTGDELMRLGLPIIQGG